MELPFLPKFDPYINKLIKSYDITYDTYDICISTGGLSGFIGAGFATYMCMMQNMNKIKIGRIFSGSAGAFIALCILLKINKIFPFNTDDDVFTVFLGIHNECMKRYKAGEKVTDAYINIFNEILPDNTYEYMNDNLFVYMTELPFFNTVIISKYENNRHLLDCIKASANIPYITTSTLYTTINGKKYIDAINVNLSKLDDSIKKTMNKIINMDIHNTHYKLAYRVQPIDKNVISLCLSGILDAHRFFSNKTENEIFNYYKPIVKSKKFLQFFAFFKYVSLSYLIFCGVNKFISLK